jgi:hypothetical protein
VSSITFTSTDGTKKNLTGFSLDPSSARFRVQPEAKIPKTKEKIRKQRIIAYSKILKPRSIKKRRTKIIIHL